MEERQFSVNVLRINTWPMSVMEIYCLLTECLPMTVNLKISGQTPSVSEAM